MISRIVLEQELCKDIKNFFIVKVFENWSVIWSLIRTNLDF